MTRVEEYFRCPFRHFANYGLRLRQLPEFQIAQQDLGSLAHRAIELVFRAAAKAEKSPAAYSDDELRAAAADAVREAVEADASGLYKDSAKNRWIVGKLTRIVTQSILVMAEQLRRGSYRPLAEELRFSSKDAPESTPALSVGSMQLRGNIDRVDTAEHEGKLYVKVVDYKTGATSWEPYISPQSRSSLNGSIRTRKYCREPFFTRRSAMRLWTSRKSGQRRRSGRQS